MKLSKRIKHKRMEGSARVAQLRFNVRGLNLGRPRIRALVIMVAGFAGGAICQRLGGRRSLILLNRAGMFF